MTWRIPVIIQENQRLLFHNYNGDSFGHTKKLRNKMVFQFDNGYVIDMPRRQDLRFSFDFWIKLQDRQPKEYLFHLFMYKRGKILKNGKWVKI